MSPMDFINELRARGVSIALTTTGKLRVQRRVLSPDEREYLAANRDAITSALAASTLVEQLIASSPSLEDDLERLTKEAASRPKGYTLFRTQRGLMHLEELSDNEARLLAAKGKLSADEVRTWHLWRERRTRYPQETRYALFALKCQRAGVHRLVIYNDGQVSLS